MTALSIPDALHRRIAETPDEPYVRVGDQTDWLTFRDVDERSTSLARGLAASGLTHGDRVLTILPNSIEVIDLLFAVAKVGAVQVAVNIYAKGDPLRHQIEDADPSMIVTDAEGFEAVRGFLSGRSKMTVVTLQAIDVGDLDVVVHRFQDLARQEHDPDVVLADSEPSDIAAISYTSGTTGPAKGCLMSHGYYTSIGQAYMSRNAFRPGDRVLAAMPCYHLGAVSLLMGALTVGMSVRLEPQFSATSFMATADKEGCTLVWGTGTMASTILRRAVPTENPTSSVERALFVPLSVPDQLEFERRYGCAVFGSYGQSEFLVVAVEDPTQDRRRTAGRPVDTLELRILDDDDDALPPGTGGEIALRPLADHAMFSGYWNNREATEAAWSSGWYHTGDFGMIDDAGELRFLDRKKDAVRRRGENVSCYEVETALVSHPDISQAAVFGVPSDLGEDDIVAALVVDTPLTAPALHAFLSERLPYFAMPRYVEFIDEVPVTATGKITKVPLRESGVASDAWDFEALGLSLSVSERRATSGRALATSSGTEPGETLAEQPVQG